MRRLARVGIVVALLLAGIVLPGSAAQACTCAMPSTDNPQQGYMEWADAVFTGEIVDKRQIKPVRVGPLGSAPRVYTIDVDTVYKGEVFDQQTLFAGGQPSACGRSFPASGEVLIFGTVVRDKPGDKGDDKTPANQSPVRYSTYLCSGSELLEPTQVPDLGEGYAPIGAEPAAATSVTDATIDTDDGASWVFPVALAAIAAALFAGVAVVVWRRRPS